MLNFDAIATPPAVGAFCVMQISRHGRVGALVLLTASASAIPVNSGKPLQRPKQ